MIWSKSSLQTYNQCPQRFKFEVIDKAKEEEAIAGNDALRRGTAFHDMVEHFYDKLEYEQMFRMVNDELLLRQYLISRMGVPLDEYVAALYDNFAIMEASRWIAFVGEKGLDAVRYFRPIMQEKEVVNHEKMLRGKIDWIFQGFDGEYILGEIKTGKIYEKSEIRKELCFLILLLRGMDIIDKDPKYIMCYYPKENYVMFEQPKQQSMNALFRMYDRGTKGLEARDFHKVIGTLCLWCPYITPCQETWGSEDWENYEGSN